MNYAEHVEDVTQNSVTNLFRTARATPADKLNWKPGEEGQSILEIIQDATRRANLFGPVMQGTAEPLTPERIQMAMEQSSQWTTLDACEVKMQEALQQFYVELRKIDNFDDIVILPFGGAEMSKAHFSLMAFQTFMYFTGQVNYVQTLYGDHERH